MWCNTEKYTETLGKFYRKKKSTSFKSLLEKMRTFLENIKSRSCLALSLHLKLSMKVNVSNSATLPVIIQLINKHLHLCKWVLLIPVCLKLNQVPRSRKMSLYLFWSKPFHPKTKFLQILRVHQVKYEKNIFSYLL